MGSTVPSARRAKGLQFSRELAAIAMHYENIAMHFSNIAVHFSNIAVHYGGNVQEKQIFLLHFSRFFVTLEEFAGFLYIKAMQRIEKN